MMSPGPNEEKYPLTAAALRVLKKNWAIYLSVVIAAVLLSVAIGCTFFNPKHSLYYKNSNQHKIAILKAQLDSSKVQKDVLAKALADTIQFYHQELAIIKEDSTAASNITSNYDSIRQTHRNLPVDSAVFLARERLRLESATNARFDYSLIPH